MSIALVSIGPHRLGVPSEGLLKNVLFDAGHVQAGTPVLLAAIALAGVLSLALIGGGIWLYHLGGKGQTSIKILGAELSTRNVGVAGIFCGAALAIFGLIRVVQAVVDLGKI